MRRALDLFTVSTMDAVKSGAVESVVSRGLLQPRFEWLSILSKELWSSLAQSGRSTSFGCCSIQGSWGQPGSDIHGKEAGPSAWV